MWGQPRALHPAWQQLWPPPAKRREERTHQGAQDKLHWCKLQPSSRRPEFNSEMLNNMSKKNFKPAFLGCWSPLQFWDGGWSIQPHCTSWWSPWDLNEINMKYLFNFVKYKFHFSLITSSRSLSLTPGKPNRGLKHTSTKDLISEFSKLHVYHGLV